MSVKSRPKPGWYVVGTDTVDEKYIVAVSCNNNEVWISAKTERPHVYYYTADKSPFLNSTNWKVTPL